MLSRVEGMSADALAAGVTFARRFARPTSSRGLDGRVGVNVGANVGHCAVRRYVMGDDASERTATDDEIVAMQELVRAALRDGAIGFTSSQLELHVAHDGRGVPSNHAAPEELVALASRARRVRPGRDRVHPAHVPRRLLRRRPRPDPRDGARVGPAGEPQHAHDDAARARRMEPQPRVRRGRGERRSRGPPDVREQPPGRALRARRHVPVRRDAELPRHAHAPVARTRAALRDPGRARADAQGARRPHRALVRVRLAGAPRRDGRASPSTSSWVDRTRQPRSPTRAAQDPLDAFLDLSLDEDLADAVRARGAARRRNAGPRPRR